MTISQKYTYRESSFELMRLIAQLMIVVYHIFLVWFFKERPNPQPIYKILWIPLHVAVPAYVIVSGYFGIKFSVKGLIRIFANLLVYGLALYLFQCFLLCNATFSIKQLFFVSNTSFWFIRTYLLLYLISPVINKILREISPSIKFTIITILAWMSCWCGFMVFDNSLAEGKNLIHFALLYITGNTLYEYKERLNQIATYKVIMAYVIVNVISAGCGYYAIIPPHQNALIFNLFFSYNSVILVFNAILFFMLFMRMKFHNNIINYAANSCLAIYMLHCFFLTWWIREVALWIQEVTSSCIMHILMVIGLAVLVVIFCVIIDKLLTPIWNLAAALSNKLTKTYIGKLCEQYNNM